MLKPVSKEARWIFGAALTTLGYIYLMSFRSPIIVDFGVLIDRTWRIYLGQVPCRDFYCPSTPLTYWIQALLFKIFSPGMFPMKVFLAVEMAVLVGLAGWLAWKVLGAGGKLLWVLLPVFMVWLPGVHLMIPWYDCDSLFFGFGALCLLAAGARTEGGRGGAVWIFLAGAASGLSFLSKQNVGGASVIAAFAFLAAIRSGTGARAAKFLAYSLGFALALAAAGGYFAAHGALKEAVYWIFQRATQRYGEGSLAGSMWESFVRILTGPENRFLKFILIFYVWALVLTARERLSGKAEGGLRLGVTLYATLAMGITILHFHGLYYPIHQVYLGVIFAVLFTSDPFRGVIPSELVRKPAFLFLGAAALLSIFWGGSMRWRQAYSQAGIHWTLDHPRLKGMYFRKEDHDLVKGLMDLEKTIPRDEKVFIMPDPLFFYYAADRVSPVPMTHFYVSGYELNEAEQKLIPGMLDKEGVRWALIGQERVFETGFLLFGMEEDWKAAVKSGRAMTSRSDYSGLRAWLDANFTEVPGPKGFWVLKRKDGGR